MSATFDFSDGGATRILDATIYTRRALARTRAAFKNHCEVTTSPVGSNKLLVSLRATNPSETREVVLEFWNYLLDESCIERLE